MLLDSDDYLNRNYFELLTAKASGSDLIFIDVNQVTLQGELIKAEKMSIYKEWNMDRILCSQMTGKIPWGDGRLSA